MGTSSELRGILGYGHWKPLWGSSDGLGGNERPDFVNKMGHMFAMDMMYRRRWQPKKDRTFELTLGGGEVDPASLC
jgi:hypothetical protein